MGAVLPVTISVSGEGFPAACTGEAVHGFPVDLLRMGIPPCLPASGRAELDPLDAVALGDRLSTAETGGQTIRRALGVGAFAGQTVPLAVTLYGAYGDSEHTRDGNVAVILLTKQNVDVAVYQYQTDRNPKELLFQFTRCMVHFAVDEAQVKFCTKLDGKKTRNSIKRKHRRSSVPLWKGSLSRLPKRQT